MYITIINTSGTSVITKSIGLIFQAGGGQGSNTPTWLVQYDDLPRIGKELTPHLSANFYWYTSDVPMDVRWFGVKADGVTDDTAALQLAFDNAKRAIDNQAPVTLFLPAGTTRVTSTVVMYGNSAMSPQFLGVPRGDNYSVTGSSVLLWDGSVGGTLFFTQGTNVGSIKNIAFHGNNKANALFVYSATTFADRSVLDASNDMVVEDCVFFGVQVGTVGAGCVQLGTDPSLTGGNTYEAAQGYFRNCYFKPEDPGAPGFSFAGMKAFGVKNMSGGNAKIFSFVDCSWLFCDVGLDNQFGSAQVVVTNFGMADVINPFKHGSGEMIIHGGDCESGDVADSTLITGGGNQAGTFCRIHGVEFVSFMAGTVGTAVNFGGQLDISHCYFRNGNDSVSPGMGGNPFRLYIGGEVGADDFSMFTSRQNWYYNNDPAPGGITSGYIPVYDNASNQNPVFPVAHTYGGNKPLQVISEGDIGGSVEQSNVAIFRNFDSNTTTYFESKWNGKIDYSYFQGGNSNSVIGTDVENVNLLTYSTSSTSTLTLPTAVGCEGRWYIVKKRVNTTATLTLTPVGGQTIDLASTYVLKVGFDSVMIFSDGANWWTFGGQFSQTDGNFVVNGQLGVNGTPAYRFEVFGPAVGGALAAVNGAGLSSGDIQLYLPGPTLTGNFNNWITGGASVTGTLGGSMTNANSTSLTADASWAVVTTGGGGGDPYLQLTISGVRAWTLGLDNSDSDKFKINSNGPPGSGGTDRFIVDVDGNITIGGTLGNLLTNQSTSTFIIKASTTDSSTAVATALDTTTAFTLAGDKLLSIRENNVEQAFFDKSGFLNKATLHPISAKRIGTYSLVTTADTSFTIDRLPAPSVSGSLIAAPAADNNRMMLQFQTAATTNSTSGISGTFTSTRFDYRPRVGFVVRTDSAITNQRIYIGITDADLSGAATLAATNTNHYVAFRYDTGLGDTNWMAVSSDGTTASAISTGVAVAINTTYTLSIDFFTSGTAMFRVNEATDPQVLKTTNLPTGATDVGLEASLTTLANTAQNLFIAKVALEQN